MQMPEKFDYTMMSTFLTCRKKYWLRIVRGIVEKEPSQAVEFGKCIHLALDEWFKSHDKEAAKKVFESSYKEDPTDEKRTTAVGKKLIELYADKYAHEGFKVLETEKVFSVRLPGLPYHLIGRIDKIIDWDGQIYVMDHKTTSRLGYEFFYKIKPNMQFDGYIFAARQLGHPTCSGVLMDALLVAKGLVIPSQLARLTPLARDVSVRSEDELLQYLSDVSCVLESIRGCYESQKWYRNTESCCDYVQCPYRKVCKEDMDIQERIIEMDYKVEPWSPEREVENG